MSYVYQASKYSGVVRPKNLEGFFSNSDLKNLSVLYPLTT